MHRQKSASELLQEERDAELARKLQEELNTSPTTNQAIYASYDTDNSNLNSLQTTNERIASPVMHDRVLDVACPVCTFINSVTAPQPQQEYRCSQCRSVLNIAEEYRIISAKENKSDANKFDQKNNSSQHEKRPTYKPKSNIENENTNTIVCNECQCLNRIPQREADAMLCGACYQKLNWTSKPIEQKLENHLNNVISEMASHPPTSSQSSSGHATNLPTSGVESCKENGNQVNENNMHETSNVEEERTVQVRCGQCGAINAVKVNSAAKSIQFLCGNCEVVNEVALGEGKCKESYA